MPTITTPTKTSCWSERGSSFRTLRNFGTKLYGRRDRDHGMLVVCDNLARRQQVEPHLMGKFTRLILAVAAAITVVSCATSPGQPDDYAPYGEEPRGPGVISGNSGKIVIFEGQDRAQPRAKTGSGYIPAPDPVSTADWEEFSAFQRWQKAKRDQDETYREFQQWLEFEEYKTWRNSQQQ